MCVPLLTCVIPVLFCFLQETSRVCSCCILAWDTFWILPHVWPLAVLCICTKGFCQLYSTSATALSCSSVGRCGLACNREHVQPIACALPNADDRRHADSLGIILLYWAYNMDSIFSVMALSDTPAKGWLANVLAAHVYMRRYSMSCIEYHWCHTMMVHCTNIYRRWNAMWTHAGKCICALLNSNTCYCPNEETQPILLIYASWNVGTSGHKNNPIHSA